MTHMMETVGRLTRKVKIFPTVSVAIALDQIVIRSPPDSHRLTQSTKYLKNDNVISSSFRAEENTHHLA